MVPGFDFSDYEAAEESALVIRYPEFAELIRRLCAG
jgi:predicted cupin superfamily sugar epimerase